MSRHIKIFGERNTSTIALKQLIEQNSESVVLPSLVVELDPLYPLMAGLLARVPNAGRLGERYIDSVFRKVRPRHAWKHAATNFCGVDDFVETVVFVTVRHPASWLLALHRRPYHALQPVPTELSAFITTPWKTVARDRLDGAVCSPIELYNKKMNAYCNFAKRLRDAGVIARFIRFEEFAVDQRAVFESIRPYLYKPQAAPALVEKSTKERSKDREYYSRYYARQEWLRHIDERAKERINDGIDWNSVERFGYEALR